MQLLSRTDWQDTAFIVPARVQDESSSCKAYYGT
jgi:hypothetical protein